MQERVQASQEPTALKIEHYTLGKTLGVGAFGKVKRKHKVLFFSNEKLVKIEVKVKN